MPITWQERLSLLFLSSARDKSALPPQAHFNRSRPTDLGRKLTEKSAMADNTSFQHLDWSINQSTWQTLAPNAQQKTLCLTLIPRHDHPQC